MILNILLQVDPEHFKQATPYSWGIYTVLVTCLAAAIVFVWRYFVNVIKDIKKEKLKYNITKMICIAGFSFIIGNVLF